MEHSELLTKLLDAVINDPSAISFKDVATWSTADNYLTYIIDGNGGGATKGYSISNGILTITWSIYDLGTGTTRTDVETWHKQ